MAIAPHENPSFLHSVRSIGILAPFFYPSALRPDGGRSGPSQLGSSGVPASVSRRRIPPAAAKEHSTENQSGAFSGHQNAGPVPVGLAQKDQSPSGAESLPAGVHCPKKQRDLFGTGDRKSTRLNS